MRDDPSPTASPNRSRGAVAVSALREEFPVVVGVGESVRTPAVREALLEGAVTDVLVVDSSADVLAAIEDRDDVGCVVTDRVLSNQDADRDADPRTTGVELCRAVRERDEALPVVFYVDDSAAETDGADGSGTDGRGTDGDRTDGDGIGTPRAALNAGASGYYTTSDSLEELRRAVDDAIETYGRRRKVATDSEILTGFLEDIGINIYVKDTEARYLRITDVPEPVDPDDAIGKTDPEIYDNTPEMARKTYEDDLRVIETGEPIRNKDERYGTGKTAYTMRTTKVPWIGDDGTTKGLLGVTIDVTEFKRQETELEILRDQFEKFTANLRHDLKNPLQVAIGHLELGRETGDDQSLDHAMEALERIEEIITDLESVAKGGPGDAEPGTTSLTEIIEAVWSVLYTGEATLKNELPASARTYTAEQTMRPIFENLFKNAVTHGGSGVTVRVGPLDDGFYVEDTGPGIPESEREAVLEAGYTTAAHGSGMGLSIVADVSAQQGWGLEIGESSDGGTRFEIANCPLVREPTADDRTDIVSVEDAPLELTEKTAVGTLEADCGAEYDPTRDRWTVTADGRNIWNHWNDFYFVSTAVDGPVSIRGRVADIEAVDPFSKAGLMIRDGLDDAATYGFVGTTPGFGTEVLWRTRRGEAGISQQLREETRSEWFRVDLLEDRVTCFVSRDGHRWLPVDQRAIDGTDAIHAGLVVCSVDAGRPCEATFENVSVVGLETTDEA